MVAIVDEPRPVARPVDEGRRRRILDALAPAVVYLAVRLVGLGVLAVMSALKGSTLLDELTSWDGAWLLAIAEHGYGGVPTDMLDAFGNHTPGLTPLGFFPGYPTAVAGAALLTGGDLVAAGLLVSWAAGVAGAYGLTRLGECVPSGSRRVGLLLTALFAAAPMGVVLSMTYTEALFCALAVWALVGVLREQWLLAGLCAAGAGLVRPTGSSIAAAVALAALLTAIHRRGWRPLAGGVLAGTGFLGYIGYVAVQTGVPGGWFAIQREGWGWYVDGGAATGRWLVDVLTTSENVFDLLTVLALAGSIALFVLAVVMRMPWPLLVYGGLALATTWGTEGLMNSKLRLLLAAFVVLLPIAIGLARRRTATAVAVVVAAALGSAWFGGYALTIWPYAI